MMYLLKLNLEQSILVQTVYHSIREGAHLIHNCKVNAPSFKFLLTLLVRLSKLQS